MANYEKNEILTDVVLYLQTVLVAESLSERAEIQRQQLLEKLSKKEIPLGRGSYMDMNGRSKGMIMKSNSFACLHQQSAYEELCDAYQPIYNNVPYEENDEYDGGASGNAGDDEIHGGYEPFAANNSYGYGPSLKTAVLNAKRHSAPNGGCGDSSSSTGSLHKSAALNGGYSLSSRSNSDSSESGGGSRTEVMYVSANAVKYSASKYGALMKREKILFVDHTRKYWAAILSSTLYVYGGDKEPKPCLVVHLDGYTARDANGGGGNRNKDWTFEVVCPGKKSYQFIAQNQLDMHSWIEAVNASSSKPSTPDSVTHSPPPVLCFKQDQLPANRELPVPPGVGAPLDYCYDKPNPVIRPVNVYENPADGDETDESIYHFIDESKRDRDASATKTDDRQFWDGDTSYYNVPSNIPVIPAMPPVKEDRNNNDYDGYFMAEKETSYDVVTNGACVLPEDPVLGVQQIIQKIEEINSKKSSPFLRRKSQPKSHHHHHNNDLVRNSTPPMYGCSADEFYEPMTKAAMQQPNGVATICGSQSFRKSR